MQECKPGEDDIISGLAAINITSPPRDNSYGDTDADTDADTDTDTVTDTDIDSPDETDDNSSTDAVVEPLVELALNVDEKKYDRTLQLSKVIGQIRKDNAIHLLGNSGGAERVTKNQQHALIFYLMDRLGLRRGATGKGYGAGSLLVKHVSLDPKTKTVVMEFVAKKGVVYFNSIHVEPILFRILSLLTEKRDPDSLLFKDTTKESFPVYFKSLTQNLAKGTKPKDMRTNRACSQYQQSITNALAEKADYSPEQMLEFQEAAILDVSVLLNHRTKMVTKTYNSRGFYIDPRIIAAW